VKTWHIVVLVIVVLLLFGARRLPDLAKSVGQSLKIFKTEMTELTQDDKPAAPAVPPTLPQTSSAPVDPRTAQPAPGTTFVNQPHIPQSGQQGSAHADAHGAASSDDATGPQH
jgi:sec-independent protein translocase protein TatA